MRAPLFRLDAFADRLFAGNPAAVILLEHFPPDAVLQALAAEMNASETAFLVPDGDLYRLRWLTPTVEVTLCGHATLASAAVVMERLEPGRRSVAFETASGVLKVRREARGYEMDMPSRRCRPVAEVAGLRQALGAEPVELVSDGSNLIARLGDAAAVRRLAPDFREIARLPCAGLVVTALSDDPAHDFVSRYFAPAKGIAEDPVTGGAHCGLAPFWAERLGKSELNAFQASRRGGALACRVDGDRVTLQGRCVFYLEGEVVF